MAVEKKKLITFFTSGVTLQDCECSCRRKGLPPFIFRRQAPVQVLLVLVVNRNSFHCSWWSTGTASQRRQGTRVGLINYCLSYFCLFYFSAILHSYFLFQSTISIISTFVFLVFLVFLVLTNFISYQTYLSSYKSISKIK